MMTELKSLSGLRYASVLDYALIFQGGLSSLILASRCLMSFKCCFVWIVLADYVEWSASRGMSQRWWIEALAIGRAASRCCCYVSPFCWSNFESLSLSPAWVSFYLSVLVLPSGYPLRWLSLARCWRESATFFQSSTFLVPFIIAPCNV